MPSKIKISMLAGIMSIILILTACSSGGGGESANVEKAANEALNALKHGDIIGRTDVINVTAISELSKGYPGFTDFKIDSVIDDTKTMKDTYVVYATITDNRDKKVPYIMLMQKNDGKWKLAAMTTAEQYKKMQNE